MEQNCSDCGDCGCHEAGLEEIAKLKLQNDGLRAKIESNKEIDCAIINVQSNSLRDEVAKLNLQVRDWEAAVNVICSCGGRGPDDGCCQACAVHHIARGRIEKRESQKRICVHEWQDVETVIHGADQCKKCFVLRQKGGCDGNLHQVGSGVCPTCGLQS